MKTSPLYLFGLSLLAWQACAATTTNNVSLTRVFSIQAHGEYSRVAALAFSPDNKILASGSGTTEAILSHGEIKLWNATNGTMIGELKGHGGLVDAIAFSPDGKFVAGGGYRLILWDVAKRKKVKTMKPGGLVHALAFSPNGKLLVSACRGQPYTQVWDVETGREQRKLIAGKDNEQTVCSVDFSRDGVSLVMGGGHQPATIWDARTWLRKAALTNSPDGHINAELVRFSPSGDLLFTTGDFNIPGKVWSVAENKVVLQLQDDDNLVEDGDYSPDGAFVATAGMERLNLWETKTGRRLQSVKGNFWSVAFSHDGQLLAVGAYGGSVQVFRLVRDKAQQDSK
jgi:WD40 repeat protein